jgi:hypothetical protein
MVRVASESKTMSNVIDARHRFRPAIVVDWTAAELFKYPDTVSISEQAAAKAFFDTQEAYNSTEWLSY